MALKDLDDPGAVTAALDEYDRDAAAFMRRYDFGPARRYFVRRGSRLYPSKAIAAAAHGYQFGRPLANDELYGGLSSAVPKLRELGFEVVDADDAPVSAGGSLEAGGTYSWDELGSRFGFRPDYLGAAGGMVSRPDHNALLLMTHPGGARSIDYGDYWDGNDLIYTGRGKYGDQERTAQNRDLGDNAREVHVFEPAGSRILLYLGSASTIEEWTAMGADAAGDQRRVLRFRLRFDRPPRHGGHPGGERDGDGSDPARRSRAFDPERRPGAPAGEAHVPDPAEAAALTEKARQDHHDLVAALQVRLIESGWTGVEEIPLAIDLWGRSPAGERWIFEVKTIRPGRELDRVRAGLAQLLEYRFLYGAEEDSLCLVTNGPIGDRHGRVLSSLGVTVLRIEGGRFLAGSDRTAARLLDLLDASAPSTA